MNLEDLGYNNDLEKYRKEQNLTEFVVGRITAEHKERYIVRTADKEYDAEITGSMRFSAQSRLDFPAVGDWVTLMTYEEDLAIIHKIFPRTSVITRQAAGKVADVQMIGANIDVAFIVQAVDRDFNINRMERYLTICNSGKVKPVIVINKTDLISESAAADMILQVQERIKNVPVLAISNETRQGIEKIRSLIEKGKTYCLLGSSGVGKSTLINNLCGKEVMKTGEINESIDRGRHVTSHRELILLEDGGMIIDNPGMREIGIADTNAGLEVTFDEIFRLAENCRFKDCTHTHESGCAVLQALENGEIDQASYQNFRKMEKERAHFESTALERRKKDKAFGKAMKNYKKDKKRNDL